MHKRLFSSPELRHVLAFYNDRHVGEVSGPLSPFTAWFTTLSLTNDSYNAETRTNTQDTCTITQDTQTITNILNLNC